jgi:Ca2+-transporting ATPase
MTGDGVNDALAITRSDTGIAMGIAGTEVAKEAADIILSDDSYVSLVEGVREGRNLYNKIRMMIFFYIAVNLAEAVLYFSTSFILDFYLLNNWQRVYIFGIVHAIPVLAIIFGPDDSDVMQLKPRQNDSILNRPLIILLSIFALSTSILLIFSYFLFYNNLNLINTTNFRGFQPNINYYSPLNSNSILQPENITQAKARTILITIIYIIECIFVYSIIRVNRPINLIFEEMNMFVHIMVFLPLLVHFSIMYILPIQLFISNYGIFFDLIQLSIIDLIYCLVISFTPIILMEYYKKYIRKSSNPEF